MSYIFDAGHYEWVMFIFFFGFQVLMTITVLNLLIAAMSEAYSKVHLFSIQVASPAPARVH